MRFIYSVIRFVPDPARGEFINIGAIVGSDESSEWQVRQIENPVRARALDQHGSLSAAWTFIDRVGRDLDAYDAWLETVSPSLIPPDVQPSEAWLEDLYGRHRNVVQLSHPAPMAAESATEAMDRVFAELIADPARRTGGDNKHPALAAVRKAYRESGVGREHVAERVTLYAGHHRERVDFAVTNGRTVQLTQAWSFQVADLNALAEHIKSWGWTIQTLQREGGHIETDHGTYEVTPDVDVEVVYVARTESPDDPAFEDARSVLNTVAQYQVTTDEAEQVGQRAAELLHVSDATPA